MTRILHLDPVGGISGDMFIAALTALLPDIEPWRTIAEKLPFDGWSAQFSSREECSLTARTLKLSPPEVSDRLDTAEAIGETIRKCELPIEVEKDALAMLALLAEAEGSVHGISPEQVHFHELSGFDTIFDLVGAAGAVHLLKPDRITCGPLPIGHGTIQTAHGEIPLPAPAALELLRDIPARPSGIAGETVTPTGAAIVRHYVSEFAAFCRGTIRKSSTAAGARKNESIPNILRAILFEDGVENVENLIVIETNIDDMNPEHYDYLFERLFESGALDVWICPAIMKKSRPSGIVGLLCNQEKAKTLRNVIFLETTTLGVRQTAVDRFALERRPEQRETSFGPVKGKRIEHPGGPRWIPEYEELKRLARETGLPLRDISEKMPRE